MVRQAPGNLSDADFDLFDGVRALETPSVYLKSLKSARLSAESVAYHFGRLVLDTVVQDEQISYYRWRHLARQLISSKKVSLAKGKEYLLLTDAWSGGHFHWFMEVLPKILVIEQQAKDFVLILPDDSYVRSVGLDSLLLLGIEFADIVWMRRGEFYTVPDLHYLTRVAPPGQVDEDLMKELNRRFRRGRPAGRKRYYISRSDARIRKVLNEKQLEPVLSEYGFEIVRPERLSLEAQIDMFAECKTIMGIHGAGLTNCLFMAQGGELVEIRKREPNYAYWHLATSVGHKYYYYHGVPDSEVSLIGNGCNLTVPVDEFRRTVLEPYM
jgi:hypothetical protein